MQYPPNGPPQFKQRKTFLEKVKEDPITPFGALVTTGILIWGVSSLRNTNAKLSQKLMRARVVAQGLTVVWLTGFTLYKGSGLASKKEKLPDTTVD